MSLLTISCEDTRLGTCIAFYQIPELDQPEKDRLKKANMPKEWIDAIADYRETYKEICEQ